MNTETRFGKYTTLLAQISEEIAKRDGKTPEEVARPYAQNTIEGMSREGLCQILADEPEIRDRLLREHKELIEPYTCRIKPETE